MLSISLIKLCSTLKATVSMNIINSTDSIRMKSITWSPTRSISFLPSLKQIWEISWMIYPWDQWISDSFEAYKIFQASPLTLRPEVDIFRVHPERALCLSQGLLHLLTSLLQLMMMMMMLTTLIRMKLTWCVKFRLASSSDWISALQ